MGQYYEDTDTMRARPSRPLSNATTQQMRDIRTRGQAMWDLLNTMPQSAEMTLAKRKIEEAVMWAVKAVTA